MFEGRGPVRWGDERRVITKSRMNRIESNERSPDILTRACQAKFYGIPVSREDRRSLDLISNLRTTFVLLCRSRDHHIVLLALCHIAISF
jgi:hypothetical protein